MSHLVLVDGNNLGFAGMANPKLTAGNQATHGTFTFIRKIRQVYLDHPKAFIMVLWDGSSWRKDIYKEYKEKRQSTQKQQVAREEYYDQKPDMQKVLTLLGVPQCFSINMEADDLAEIYSRRWKGKKVTLVSGDMDWIQLVDERTTWHDPIRERTVNLDNFKEFTGYKDAAQFVEAKSILGDKDEVPGIKGIGPGYVEQLYKGWGSIRHFLKHKEDDFQGCMQRYTSATGKKCPKVLRELDRKETEALLAFNDKLGDLRTKHRPEPINLNRKQMKPDIAGFEDLCYKLSFLSITRKLEVFVGPFIHNTYTLKNDI